MLRVGLTGGIACGKSVVAEMLAARGAHVIYADRVAHELMRPGESVYRQVVERFGPGILNADQTINRAALAQVAFRDPAAVAELNRLVHPPVIARQDEWMDEIGRREPDAVAVVEAALILEAGAANRFDKIVVVSCAPELKPERLARRTGMDLQAAADEVARRSAAQLADEEKVRRADYVIDNSGTLAETEKQVASLFRELKHLAARSQNRGGQSG